MHVNLCSALNSLKIQYNKSLPPCKISLCLESQTYEAIFELCKLVIGRMTGVGPLGRIMAPTKPCQTQATQAHVLSQAEIHG